jgi:Rieske 2Fe-2S family protein
MSTELNSSPLSSQFSGLTRLEPSLPSRWYFDPAHFAIELEHIWYRNWVYLCRSSSLPEVGSYRTFTLGTQPLLLLRDEEGHVRGFFNTCRHRGALLCAEPSGRLPERGITCPYHAWHYRLSGQLDRIPSAGRPHHVSIPDSPLHEAAVHEWRGFLYAHLGRPPALPAGAPPATHFSANSEAVCHWPLEDLVVGHRLTQRMRCNWKIFWENYNECLHCPNVHPALSSLVPIYRRRIMEPRDDPAWPSRLHEDTPAQRGGLRAGARTWSRDGRPLPHEFTTLTADERRAGYHFVTHLPAHYVVAHVDYVRSSRLLPLGPEETEIEVEWLFPRQTLEDVHADITGAVEFSAQVLAEDAAVCERNQRGLHALAHAQGMLMPEEYELYRLHCWVRDQLPAAINV